MTQAFDSPKEFRGRRERGTGDVTVTVVVCTQAGLQRLLPTRLDLCAHSPGGFEWGYGGSGPAQLALALCCALVEDSRALEVHQRVKDDLLSGLEADSWVFTVAVVRGAIERAEAHLRADLAAREAARNAVQDGGPSKTLGPAREFRGSRQAPDKRGERFTAVFVHHWPAGARPLLPRHDLRDHSPGGYEWGYDGSGPAQLALALCCAVTDDDTALLVYQALKEDLVMKLDADRWTLPADQVRGAIARLLPQARSPLGPPAPDRRRLAWGPVVADEQPSDRVDMPARLADLVDALNELTPAEQDGAAGRPLLAQIRGAGQTAAWLGGIDGMRALAAAADLSRRRDGQRQAVSNKLNALWSGIGSWIA